MCECPERDKGKHRLACPGPSAQSMTPDPTTRDPAARLRACIELAAKATPGPWACGVGTTNEPASTVYCDDSLGSAIATCGHRYTILVPVETEKANAATIAAAVNFLRDAAPALLAEVERLKGELAASQEWQAVFDTGRVEALDRAEAAEQVAREARELLQRAWRVLDTAEPNLQITENVERFLAHHGARTGESTP